MADQTATPAPPPAEFQRGPAGPDQQQYGAATAPNEAVAAIPDQPAPVEPVAPETPQTQAAPAPGPEAQYPPPFTPGQHPTEQYLFGAPQTQSALMPVQPVRLGDFPAWLTALGAAANSPDASDSTKALFRTAMAAPLP